MKDIAEFMANLRNCFSLDVEKDIDKIIEHIRGIKGKLKVTAKALDFDDFVELSEMPEEELHSYELTEDGVVFLIYAMDIFNLIKGYIDSDITELEMPVSALCDAFFLERMNNLKTIDIAANDYLNGSSLKAIVDNSNVSNINVEGKVYSFIGVDDIISMSSNGSVICSKYRDVFIRGENSHNYNDVSLSIGNIGNFEDAWQLFLEECDDRDDLELAINCLDEVQLFDKEVMSLSFKDGKISKADINIDTDDISIVLNVLQKIEEHFNDDTKVSLHIKNRTYDGFDKVAEILKKYNSEIVYSVDYDFYCFDDTTDVDGFEYMRSTIDYYKSLINEYDLSPYEKLIYAYDLIKSYSYSECEDDKNKSRDIPEIIKDGYIVCVGYAHFLGQLLNELGINAAAMGLSVFDNGEEFGHARNILYLKDDKYGIDGVYSLDATYDSRRDNLSLVLDSEGERVKKKPKENDTILKKYDPTALFCNFLIPHSEYYEHYTTEIENVYEALPDFIYYTSNANSLSEFDMSFFVDNIKKLFGNDCDVNECVNKVKNSLVISNDKLRRALETVKKCQGFSDEDARSFVDDVIEIRELQNERIRKFSKKNSTNDDVKAY